MSETKKDIVADPGLLYISFNQDSTCFTCGTERGFIVYNCDPVTERFSRLVGINSTDPLTGSGIGLVEMLHRSNIFILVGGGVQPKYPTNVLIIWDDFQKKCIAELEFATPIKSARLRKDVILVSIAEKTFAYNFADLKQLAMIDTCVNDTGVSAMNCLGRQTIIAAPGAGAEAGEIIVRNLGAGTSVLIPAHKAAISRLALSPDGLLLASVSERGTLVRIWDTATGSMVRELRRGAEPTRITSLAFDASGSKLCVCGAKGTVHLFGLGRSAENKKSSLVSLGDYLPGYFSSEWSAVSFTVLAGSICTFGNADNVLYVVSGTVFTRYVYDIKAGTVSKIESIPILVKS